MYFIKSSVSSSIAIAKRLSVTKNLSHFAALPDPLPKALNDTHLPSVFFLATRRIFTVAPRVNVIPFLPNKNSTSDAPRLT